MMKNKVIALLLAMVMVASLLPTAGFAVEADEFTVVVSMEGLTLGQGLYVEPTAYTLDEINALIAEEGYGPYTEDDLPASMATLAMMLDQGLEYENTGSWDSGFYLSAVKGLDKGMLNIPTVITENGGPSNEENDGNDDEWLGEFDYNWMSGWMITVNDFMIDVGCSDWVFTQGASSGRCEDYGNIYVVCWQFTVDGYGADLGHNTGWGNEAYFDHVNKDMMYAAYALSDDAAAKASVMPTMEKLTATADEVAAAEAALAPKTAAPAPKLTGMQFYAGDLDAGLTPDFDADTLSGYSVTLKSAKSSMSIRVTAPEGCTVQARHQGYKDETSNLEILEYALSTSGWSTLKGFASTDGEGLYGTIPVEIVVTNADQVSATYKLTVVHPDPNPAVTPPDEALDVSGVLSDTMAQLAATVTAPSFGTSAGEWTVLSLARGGYYAKDSAYFAGYYERIVETVNETAASVSLANGALHKNKSTDNARLILALSSIGKDATSVGDWNLITPFDDFAWIKKQGINGPIFALIALDTHDYQTTDPTIRQQCVDYILGLQLADGGWALSGETSDPDITAMALQALVNYKDQTAVSTAAEKAFAWLSSAQTDAGGYASWGTVNSESAAQVITACTAWGINPDTDPDFIKGENSVIDYILTFYDAAAKGFKHTLDGSVDAMATDQACYALVAYDRFLNEKASLYDMSDVAFDSAAPDASDGITASLGLPAKVEAGQSFQGIVSVNEWDNEAGYKLIDFMMNVSEGLTVTDVTASGNLTGGEVRWNVDEEGKLRVVYFDANENQSLAVSSNASPAELFTISLNCTAKAGTSLELGISGMSLKLTSDSSQEEAMVIVNTDRASGTIEVMASTVISYSAVRLYTGDDVDLIPAAKMAVAVSVTGIAPQSKLSYNDGTNEVEFLYSAEISEKTGVSSYVALVDSTINMESFINSQNYDISGTANTITFGDSNDDGVVNAQDALAAVDCWLRKGEEPTDLDILTLNVNGDSRINTFDALGIVEAFVNGTDYAVVTNAAILATNR